MKKVPDTLKNFWNKRKKMRRRDAKRNGETATKVSPAFSKAAQSRTRSPCRAPQSAKSLFGVSFCLAFSLRLGSKEKAAVEFARENKRDESGGKPFSGKGLPSAPFPRTRGNVHTTLPKALEQRKKFVAATPSKPARPLQKFRPPFQRRRGQGRASPCRAPQSAKSLIGVSFCPSLLQTICRKIDFCPTL